MRISFLYFSKMKKIKPYNKRIHYEPKREKSFISVICKSLLLNFYKIQKFTTLLVVTPMLLKEGLYENF